MSKRVTQKRKRVLIFMLSDDVRVTNTIVRAYARKRSFDPVLVATDYDYVNRDEIEGHKVLLPMEILSAGRIAEIYNDYYNWQSGLPSLEMSNGATLQDNSSPQGYTNSAESWLIRFGNQMQVRMRFVALISEALKTFEPEEVATIGYSKNHPWSLKLLRRIVRQKCPDVAIQAPTQVLSEHEASDIWYELNEKLEHDRAQMELENQHLMAKMLKTKEKYLSVLTGEHDEPKSPAQKYPVQRLANYFASPETRHLLTQDIAPDREHVSLDKQIEVLGKSVQKQTIRNQNLDKSIKAGREKMASMADRIAVERERTLKVREQLKEERRTRGILQDRLNRIAPELKIQDVIAEAPAPVSKENKELLAEFRQAISDGEHSVAIDAALAYINAIEANPNEKVAGGLVRGLINANVPFEQIDYLLFTYIDKFPANNAAGRVVTKTIVSNDAIEQFEAFVRSRYNAEDLRMRAAFYEQLQNSFIKYASKLSSNTNR